MPSSAYNSFAVSFFFCICDFSVFLIGFRLVLIVLMSPVSPWFLLALCVTRLPVFCCRQALELKGIGHLGEKDLKERNKRIQEENRRELQKVSGQRGRERATLPSTSVYEE